MSDRAISSNNVQFSFRGIKKTDQGNPYYKTHKGVNLGLKIAIPAGAIVVSPAVYKMLPADTKSLIEKCANNCITKTEELFNVIGLKKHVSEQGLFLEKLKSWVKSSKKQALVIGALALGTGIVTDAIRHDKASSLADDVANGKTDHRNDLANSKNGKNYSKTKIGRYSWLISGTIAGSYIMLSKVADNGILERLFKNNKKNPLIVTLGIIAGTASGWLLGRVNDNEVNKKAAKKADKIAEKM